MTYSKVPTLTLEKAQLVHTNFAGLGSTYNLSGHRNFCVLLPDEDVQAMKKDGWMIRYIPGDDEDDLTHPYVSIKIKLDYPSSYIFYRNLDGSKQSVTHLGILDQYHVSYDITMTAEGLEWEVGHNKGVVGILTHMELSVPIRHI